jgi:hypothetical protein
MATEPYTIWSRYLVWLCSRPGARWSALCPWRYDLMYGSVTKTHVKENPCMVLIPSSVLNKYRKILFNETLYGYIAITYF